MANSALLSLDLAPSRDDARPKLILGRAHALASVVPGLTVRVAKLELEPDMCTWLSAVGIGLGEMLTVLRRAAFGGPLHVRTSAGGEFALNLSLARSILIRPIEEAGESVA
jgi:Fe2+ transport system protein FeoA